jgi:hypothetical protein
MRPRPLSLSAIQLPYQYNSTTKQETEGMKEIIALPDYKIEIPSKKLVKCLEIINDHDDGKVSKKRLRDIAL